MNRQQLKVVKIGGRLIEDKDRLSHFLKHFSALEDPKILVHGGGNLATEVGFKLGHQAKMIDGRRITDADSLKIIIMTYAGLINKTIVANLQGMGLNAMGLCGADGMSILSKKRAVTEVDYGFVGDIEKVDTRFISSFLDEGITPVFSALSCTREGELMNTNADSIAAEIAAAFSKSHSTALYYCFEKKGVLAKPRDEGSVIKRMDKKRYLKLVKEKTITEGMLPKLHNCFAALDRGVATVVLGDENLLQDKFKHTTITQ